MFKIIYQECITCVLCLVHVKFFHENIYVDFVFQMNTKVFDFFIRVFVNVDFSDRDFYTVFIIANLVANKVVIKSMS